MLTYNTCTQHMLCIKKTFSKGSPKIYEVAMEVLYYTTVKSELQLKYLV